MASGRSIAAFAVKFLVIYGALAASWPLCGEAYAFFLRESGNLLFEAVGADHHVRIRPATPPYDEMKDTLLLLRQSASTNWTWTKISSWEVGFLSMSMLVGLTLGTPLGWYRRVWAFVGGMVVLHAFVLVRLSVVVVAGAIPQVGYDMRDPFGARVLGMIVTNFTVNPAVSCFVPVLIWLAVTMRREDAWRLVASTQKKVTA
ncbi:MAG: hypothetical protein V1790_17285 [Planctomycetota bacterium]